ncbi:MAG: hypothetical protein EBS48_10570 [Actinobacteria bacterium]|nr:hypothetical protein [Actinomycetota bacterium]
MTWTVDDVLSWRTCYPDGRIRELCAGVERVTVEWVAALDIPAQDRVCFLLRPEVMTQWLDHIRVAAALGQALGAAGVDAASVCGVASPTWGVETLCG